MEWRGNGLVTGSILAIAGIKCEYLVPMLWLMMEDVAGSAPPYILEVVLAPDSFGYMILFAYVGTVTILFDGVNDTVEATVIMSPAEEGISLIGMEMLFSPMPPPSAKRTGIPDWDEIYCFVGICAMNCGWGRI